MRELIRIGNQKMDIDVLKGAPEEELLYLSIESLISMKEECDKRASAYQKGAMEFACDPFEQVYPDPAVVYDMALQQSMMIAAIIIYKNINNYRGNLKHGNKRGKQLGEEKARIILDMICQNRCITYFDIINARHPEEELEEELEILINQKILSCGLQQGQYHEKFDGWIINTTEKIEQ